MVRNVDYESRKRAVLSATIDKYIKDAVPVASQDLCGYFDLSSATIRNILSELEREGYITHVYTSGGRIPTNKGYRYYVDYLISQIDLLDKEKEAIKNEFKHQMRRLEDVLEETSEILSSITHYASIVSFLDWQDRFFYKGISLIMEQPEFHDLTRMRLLMRMIENKRNLLSVINREFEDKVKVYIGEELSCPEMNNCSLAVSRYRIKDRLQGRLAVLGPMRMEYGRIIPKLEYVAEVLSGILDEI